MNQDLLRRAEKLNKVRQSRSRMNRATRILSLVIALSTIYALMLPAITINNDTVCGMEEHTHTEACYAVKPVLICGKTEAEAHAHTESCYTVADGYICGKQEIAPHVHTDACYGTQNRLTCSLLESEEHTHTESCYTSEKVLRCTLSTEGHIHGPECLGQERLLSCGREETEGHVHSDACYEDQRVLACGMEEHIHTAECYPRSGDDMADVETKEIWEAPLAALGLTDDWTENVLKIAASQLGYTESEANFRYVNGEKKGYSRYGAWYGDPYGDWCAMFVSFCLRYGGVPEELFPSHSTCRFWAELLYELGRFAPAQGTVPRPGDVVFFDTQEHISPEEPRIPDHVGLVVKVAEDKLTTIEGNINNSVVLREYDWDDPTLFGYGLLPEKLTQPDNEKELTDGEELTGEDAKHTDDAGEPQDNDDADAPEDTEPVEEPKDTEGETGEDKELSEELTDGDKDNDTDTENDTEAEKDSENDTDKENETENETGLPEVKAQNISGTKLLEAAMSIYDAAAGFTAEELIGDAKAFFVTACVELAELKDSIPCFENCAQWALELTQRGLLKSPADGYIPAPGDLVLFDLDADSAADSIGIVTDADSESGELVTLESDAAAQVSYQFYKLSDTAILGYYSTAESAVIPENTDAAEDADEKEETEEKEETSISAESEDGVTVTVTGQLPEGAQVVLTPVSEEVLAEIMASVGADTPVFAYDITIVDGEGQAWQPDELGVSVSITGLSIPEDAETEVTHVPDDGEITQVEAVVTEDTVEFTADGFSIYVVYYVGKEGEIDGESSTLHFENELISADLTVSPKLSEDAAFSIEKIDRTLEAEKWEIMSASVLETLKAEQGEAEEIPAEESAETEKEEGIQLYALKLTADGQELSLDENYAVKLEARLNVTAPEEEEPEPGEAIRIFALNHEEENREQKKEDPVTENLVSDDPLAGIIPEALVEKASDSEASQKKYTATPLKASLSREQQSVGVDYTGEGLDGLAMLTATLGDAPAEGTTGGTASPVSVTTELSYHKQIDYLGDNEGGDDKKDQYRLYLDAGPLQYSEPMDLLIVVDRSQSMSTEDFGGMRRDAAVSQILNGTEGNEGLISRFLSLHEDNEVAAIAFFGERDIETDPFAVTNGDSKDTTELLDWTDKDGWDGKSINCMYPGGDISCTDYCAAYLKMASMLNAKAGDEKQKMVIFLSDGVPTYYLQDKDGGGYERLGSGSPTESDNVSICKTGTESFFTEKFGALAPIYPIAIGSTGETSFSPDVLEYMSVDGVVRTANDAAGLTQVFENIIYGAAVKVSDLTISDTLSDYVDMLGNIKVTAIKDGTETTLYERAGFETTELTGSAITDTGGKCTAPLRSVSYDLDPESKQITKITAALDDTTYGLDTSTQYILSFDVKTSASASVTYSLKERYTDTGDEDTDYGENETSSEQPGFYSNKEATLRYKLNSTEKTAEYPKPVVQVVEEGGGKSDYTVSGYITQHKTIDWLGDKTASNNNPDTDLDNGSATAASLEDYYRLYLDSGQYKISEPIDLLIVVDKSNSMNETDMSHGESRYQVIEDILNSTDSIKGFIETFLDMDERNQYAVVSFGGAVDGGQYNSSMTRLYTRDSESVRNWGRTVPKDVQGSKTKISCTPNSQWGTNYSAAMYRARDMLREGRSDIRKLMIFISDGEPTFWMTDDDTRYGDGSKSKSFSTGSYKIDNIPTRTRNVAVTKERIDDLWEEFPNMGLYVIGVAGPGKLDTELLNYMATGGENGVYTSLDYDELLTAFENILYGNAGDFKALKITDTLSDYVELYNNNADILVTLTESSGTTNKLYERPLGSTVNFTDTPGTAESYFKPANTKDGKQLLTSVSYDAVSKTITAQFNPDIKLTKSSKYELSFNVKVTDQAKEEYEENVLSERDPYAGMAGDKSTDYPGNTSSSEKSGFRSNLTAAAAYSVGGTAYNIPYDHPVVQTKGSILNLTVKKNWSVEPEDDREVKIKLYSSPNETTACTFVQEITLNKDNDWEARVEGLKRSDASSQELHYYILETPLDGYLAEYAHPVYNLTIGEKVEAVAGEAQIPETPTGSVYEGTAAVTNNPGVVLPETGGSGEALYTDLGILLLAMGFMLMAGKTDDRENNLRRGRIQ